MALLFIADLHLSPERPDDLERFAQFLNGPARRAQALYILGDLFDLWLRDDLSLPAVAPTVRALRGLVDAGVALRVMRGNRDFMLGAAFAAAAGAELLPDPFLLAPQETQGEALLLSHGDLFCTDDKGYQRLRRVVRNATLQRLFNRLAPARARAVGGLIYRESGQRKREKPSRIMEINDAAALQAMRRHKATTLIHGHIHRPERRALTLDGRPALRIAMDAWCNGDAGLSLEAGQLQPIRAG